MARQLNKEDKEKKVNFLSVFLLTILVTHLLFLPFFAYNSDLFRPTATIIPGLAGNELQEINHIYTIKFTERLPSNETSTFFELTEENRSVTVPFEVELWIDQGLIKKYHLTRISYFGIGSSIYLNKSTASFTMEFATKDDPMFNHPLPSYSANDSQYYTNLNATLQQYGWVPRPYPQLTLPDFTLLNRTLWPLIETNDRYVAYFYSIAHYGFNLYVGTRFNESGQLQDDLLLYDAVALIEINLDERFITDSKIVRPEGYALSFHLLKYVVSGWLRFTLDNPLPEEMLQNVTESNNNNNTNTTPITPTTSNQTTTPLKAKGEYWVSLTGVGLMADANGTRFIDSDELLEWEDAHKRGYVLSWEPLTMVLTGLLLAVFYMMRRLQRNKIDETCPKNRNP